MENEKEIPTAHAIGVSNFHLAVCAMLLYGPGGGIPKTEAECHALRDKIMADDQTPLMLLVAQTLDERLTDILKITVKLECSEHADRKRKLIELGIIAMLVCHGGLTGLSKASLAIRKQTHSILTAENLEDAEAKIAAAVERGECHHA